MNRTELSILAVVVGLNTPAMAATINVPADFALIQDAINAASAGDEIVVAPGAYNQRIDFVGKSIIVRSQNINDPTLTMLNGAAGGTVVTFNSGEGPGSQLIGFTVDNGMAPNGGGVLVGPGCSPNLENCHIQRNQAQIGGGINILGAPNLRRCWFIANVASISGGGLWAGAGSNPTLDGCRFEGNDGPMGSAAHITDGATILNTEAFDNVTSMAFALEGNAPVTMINCTVVGHATAGIVLAGTATAMATIANSIVRNNALQIVGAPGLLNVRYCNVQGGFAGPGNVDVNPQFVNPAIDDFRLLPNSMCIDAGENAIVPTGVFEDFRGVDRFADRAGTPDTGAGASPIVDIGAHEFPPPRRYVDAAAVGLNHGGSWNHAYLDLQDALDDARIAVNGITEVFVAEGTYHPDRGTGDRARSFDMISDVAIIGGFVGGETDLSQSDPMTNQTVLGGAIGAAGDSDNSYHVVKAINVNAGGKLIGFIVQKGRADDVGPEDFGGGMYVDQGAPLISECWIRQNYAVYGGGAYFFGGTDARLLNCRININEADIDGGGLLAFGSSVELINCYLSGNECQGNGGAIAVYSASTVTLTNNSIVGNTSSTGAVGGVSVAGDVIATNNIIGLNTGASGTAEEQQIKVLGAGTADINYCNVQGWTGALGGAGNSAADPQMVDSAGADNLPGTADDDPRLSSTSPCIDSADGDALPGFVETDLDGEARSIDNSSVVDTGVGSVTYLDRGAFELQQQPCSGELSGDTTVGVPDLLFIINNWGPCAEPKNCPADISPEGPPVGDDLVGVPDLLMIINNWGPCP